MVGLGIIFAVGFSVWSLSIVRDHRKSKKAYEAERSALRAFVEEQFAAFLDAGGALVHATTTGWGYFVFRLEPFELHISNYMDDWEVRCHQALSSDHHHVSDRHEQISIPLHVLARYFNGETPQEAAGRAATEDWNQQFYTPLRERIVTSAELVTENLEQIQTFFHPENLDQNLRDYNTWCESIMEVVKPVYEQRLKPKT